jgi:thiamine-monophosphate kinase
MKRAVEMGEDALIARMLAQLPALPADVHTGPGDDCAVVPFSAREWQLLKTDAIVEGVHFLPEEKRERVGWKAIARVVSDFAAMGGVPQWFLVTVGVPRDTRVELLENLYRGIADCMRIYGGSLVGGETTRVADEAGLVISVAATGRVSKKHLVLRSTARQDDRIFVSGTLGGSLAGRHLDIVPRVAEAGWLARRGFATAMMDLSDGLAKDLPRLANASACGFLIESEKIPCTTGSSVEEALRDGEDYELLFTVAAQRVKALERAWAKRFPNTPLREIGRMVAASASMRLQGGWDHFSVEGI